MHALIARLLPICRSITGDGVRETLRVLCETLPLIVHEVPSGTPVLDWTVPKEWNARDAWVANAAGERVIDFRENNLHLMGYSIPVRARLSLAELRARVATLPDRPDWIPYRTSYYNETWGFCARESLMAGLPEGDYEVCVDTTLEDGSLTYGELVVPGRTGEEVLLSCHVCHPAMCNDNLSGIALMEALGRGLMEAAPQRYTYRLLFIPGTIGAITWLARNPDAAARVRHGLVITGVGDAGPLTYKRSRRGDAPVDRAAAHVLHHAAAAGAAHRVIDFSPYGYDERQYCSPGFDLAVGRLSRSPHGEFPEYHTSADDLDFVRPEELAGSLAVVRAIIDVLERDRRTRNLSPFGEPQLGRRGLYRAIGGTLDAKAAEMALLWVLNMSDGGSSLLDIAVRADMPFAQIAAAAERLGEHGLLEDLPG
jgi:aminopeptidase-like protein